ncbi:hypothetical protein IGI67_004523 [Enterococcus sp. AZ196]
MLTVEDASFEELTHGIASETLQSYSRLKEFSKEEILYNSILLINAEYLSGKNSMVDYAGNVMFELNGLTWSGHHFLDTVRDPKVWRETKKVAGKFASVSLTFTERIAASIITGLIKKETGLPL